MNQEIYISKKDFKFMEYIKEYSNQEDGKYSIVIKNVELSNDQTLLLDNGHHIAVDVRVPNPYKITPKQRKKIFALLNDIEIHTGTPREYMRSMFQEFVEYMEGYAEKISLSNCDKETASKVIEVIIQWVFIHNIPLNYKTSDLMRNDNYFIYLSTINRQCVICGKPGDLAHEDAVGSGRNRRKIDHSNYRILALCREHHVIQHQIGIKSFNERYHLENSWVDVNTKINNMLKGRE